MSLTLKVATATTVVFTKAKTLANGMLMQLIGASYALTARLKATQTIGNTGTARSRCTLAWPYQYTNAAGLAAYDNIYITVETTVPATAPQTEVAKAPWLAQSLTADPTFMDLIVNRAITYQ